MEGIFAYRRVYLCNCAGLDVSILQAGKSADPEMKNLYCFYGFSAEIFPIEVVMVLIIWSFMKDAKNYMKTFHNSCHGIKAEK